eukprot:CAMPEP_0197551920 /NCGR_PEP_ID=MMETSP1320-20131121/5564_1 /TAXON_ID=91990 /ORGANISM="Bolidomonas sp., Strain RCC2347" /LENGTH=140 /DNA_ID=CAMNT_0043112475 /DNA_START=83 /DNA_END=502 /DNA_ORIENTATION=-
MGDFVEKFARPDTGTNTVEGQVSGNLAAIHAKKREKQQKEFEEKKAKIEADAKRGTKKIDEKFEQTVEKVDKSDVVGLVTASEWKARMEQKNKRKDSMEAAEDEAERARLEKEERARKRKKKKKKTLALSFSTGDDDDEE